MHPSCKHEQHEWLATGSSLQGWPGARQCPWRGMLRPPRWRPNKPARCPIWQRHALRHIGRRGREGWSGARGERRSRVARSRADRASAPARVRITNWYGLVALSRRGAHAAASERETRRRNMSPSLCFARRLRVCATKAMPSATSRGTVARASKLAASEASGTLADAAREPLSAQHANIQTS